MRRARGLKRDLTPPMVSSQDRPDPFKRVKRPNDPELSHAACDFREPETRSEN